MGSVATGIRSPEDLSAAWLSETLAGPPVARFDVTRIGTGQMSDSYRVSMTYAATSPGAPDSVILKVASSNETSRRTGGALGLYEREVRFYTEVAPLIGGPLAPCFAASFHPDDDTFCLLLGDAGPARQGDEIVGATRAEADIAIAALADLHRPVLGSDALAGTGWLNRPSPISQDLMKQLLAGFLDRYSDRISPEHQEVCKRLTASFEGWTAAGEAAPQGIVHGDYRLDNLLFGEVGSARPLTVVDWQTVAWGSALTDLAYFLGCALTVENRRAWGEELLLAYHAALGEGAPSLEECREGLRQQSFFGVLMAIISPMLVERTERGDDMFMAVLERHAKQVLDLDALALLPDPTSQSALRPTETDEHPHPPGDERLWNESWYFDLADTDQGLGLYLRLGLYPNLERAWYTGLICGPGRPTVAIIDFQAPLPGDDLALETEQIDAKHGPEAELERYRVTLSATGEAHDDPAAILRGERGRPVDIALDLVWHTDGAPYQYRIATRYEIPCRARGTLMVGAEAFTLDAVGQRDHSWGERDWWSMDWVWAAGHLDDGTHLHAVDLRIPGAPPLGVGYVQSAGGDVTELESVTATETIGDDGLPLHARLVLQPGGMEVEVEPLGHGPLALADDDGRVAQFPRAWCRLSAADGRDGVGWLEWNRNIR
jgi:thiamine kinase-like enzyme